MDATFATKSPPPSCNASWINLLGLSGLVGTTFALPYLKLEKGDAVIVTLTVTALIIIVLENLYLGDRIAFKPLTSKGYRSVVVGRSPIVRVLLKLLGLGVSIAALASLYWLFPIYRGGAADDLGSTFKRLALPLAALTPLYIWYVDKKSDMPEDGYFHVGLAASGAWRLADFAVIQQHCLQWLVKAFFLPLMISYYFRQIDWVMSHPIMGVITPFWLTPNTGTWLAVFEFLYSYLFLVDIAFACIGYVLTLKLLDSEARSTDPTFLGWAACLVCYEPFWGLIGQQYLNYDTGALWKSAFVDWPLVKSGWALLILSATAIYAWATVQFGIRFSNLTHRGIITNGPYRWLKHPAYVCKNLAFWLISMPFLANGGAFESLRHAILLAGLNLIYYLRARTEERHLMIDPVYAAYVEFMRNNDAFAVVRRRVERHTQVQ